MKAHVLQSERIFKGSVFTVRRDTLSLRARGTQVEEVVEHPGAVAVVPVVDTDEVIVVEQYRHAIGESLLEIPAGTLEKGESPIHCARRELLEETGFQTSRLTRLLRCFLAPGYSSEIITIYAATALRQKFPTSAPLEQIKLRKLKLKKIISMIKRNQITDAKTICGIFGLISRGNEV